MKDRSVRIPFFDELLPVSEIAPRIRSEIETVLSRTSEDSPDYAKLQNLQFILSGDLKKGLSEALSRTLTKAIDCSEDFPESLRELNRLIGCLEF